MIINFSLSHQNGTTTLSLLPIAVVIVGMLVGITLYGQVWFFDENGFSIVTKTTPYWDFNNLWSGSRMALDGHVNWLFDADLYREELRRRIHPEIPNHEWSYPPSLLLIGAPLALLPEFSAYILWTLATIGLLFMAVRSLELPKHITLAIVLCPAVFINAAYGQNGALTAGLLIAGLSLARKKPVLAGICFGVLTIKPQLGVLIPFFLLASGNWRAIISAG
ncbi:MAG: DUF2029 domain-containing protein, partial [Robiginitomaculum sp.]|nr:DUF2029 domain-containing protein [Robiginitomaculum sp.]